MTTERFKIALAAIQDMSLGGLVDEADCGYPDRPSPDSESEGVSFLLRVQNAVVEALDYDHTDDETVEDTVDRMRDRGDLHELADGAVPVYTHRKWATFVDLQAYREDATDLGFDGSDMEQGAGICLYMIAERLAEGLCRVAIDAWNDTDDE